MVLPRFRAFNHPLGLVGGKRQRNWIIGVRPDDALQSAANTDTPLLEGFGASHMCKVRGRRPFQKPCVESECRSKTKIMKVEDYASIDPRALRQNQVRYLPVFATDHYESGGAGALLQSVRDLCLRVKRYKPQNYEDWKRQVFFGRMLLVNSKPAPDNEKEYSQNDDSRAPMVRQLFPEKEKKHDNHATAPTTNKHRYGKTSDGGPPVRSDPWMVFFGATPIR